MSDRKWRHHYVPQFYLRRFTSTPNAQKDKKKIWFYDKQTGETGEHKIINVAYDRFFNDLPLSVLPAEFAPDIQEPEEVLALTEGQQAIILTDILERIDKGQPWLSTPQEKYNLAAIVAVMYLRTPGYRIVFEEALKILSPDELKAYAEKKLKGEQLPGPMPEGDELIAALARRDHQIHLHNPASEGGEVENMAMFLDDNFIWVIGENTSAEPFYTSDTPFQHVCFADTPEEAESGKYTTLMAPGAVGIFPLTPKYAVLLFNRIKYANMVGGNGNRIPISGDMVTFWNETQVRGSEQFVFCNENSFDTARSYLTENPQYSNPALARAGNFAEIYNQTAAEIRSKLL